MKHTDYKVVFDLARNIIADDKKLIASTEQLSASLKNLEGTFLDDGIDEVKSFVAQVEKILKDSQDAFMTTAGELGAFAELLNQGK